MTGVLLDGLKAPYLPSDYTPGTDNAIRVRHDDGDGGASTGLWEYTGGAWVRVGAAARHASQHLLAGADPLALPQYDRDLGLPGVVVPQVPLGMGAPTTTTLTAARSVYGRFVPCRAMSITLAAFLTTVAAGSNDPIEIAIYNGTTLAQVATSGAVTGKVNATAGLQTVPITASLDANTVYYVGLMCLTITSTSATFEAISVGPNAMSNMFGTAGPKLLLGFHSGETTAMPATANLGSAQNAMPTIALRES